MCRSPSTPLCSVASVKGVAVRIMYAIHVIICLWTVMGVVDRISLEENMVTEFFGEATMKLKYYLVGIIGFYLLLTFAECGVIVKRQGGEFKWFSPSILLYILMVVPCIWVVEWQMHFERIDYRLNNSISTCNTEDFNQLDQKKRVLLGFPENDDFTSQYGLTTRDWSLGLQQVMLFVLIVGRWLSPKGDISRDQLSQLLMVHFGTAADILEYVTEGLSNSVVMCNHHHILIVLIVWSVSLLQFTLNPAATRNRLKGQMRCLFVDTEIWSIFVSTLVQDAPFLGTRLYFMVYHQSRNQSSIFFTCKNALLLLIQTYRVLTIICDAKKKPKKGKKTTTFDLQSSPASRRRGPAKSSGNSRGRFRNANIRLPLCLRNIMSRYRVKRQISLAKNRDKKKEGCLSGLKCFTMKKTTSNRAARRWSLPTFKLHNTNSNEPRRRHSSKGVLRPSSPKETDGRSATFI